MATFLDVTGLEAFSKIFVFVLVLLVVYGVLAMSNVFKSSTWISWIVALVLAIFVILSDLLSGIIRYVAPWFAILFIFVIFIIVASRLFGGTETDFLPYKNILIVVVILVFVVGALLYIRQHTPAPGDKDSNGNVIKESNFASTADFMFHPKVMGIIFVLLVAIFTVALLAGKAS
jgi:hypothetical protein